MEERTKLEIVYEYLGHATDHKDSYDRIFNHVAEELSLDQERIYVIKAKLLTGLLLDSRFVHLIDSRDTIIGLRDYHPYGIDPTVYGDNIEEEVDIEVLEDDDDDTGADIVEEIEE